MVYAGMKKDRIISISGLSSATRAPRNEHMRNKEQKRSKYEAFNHVNYWLQKMHLPDLHQRTLQGLPMSRLRGALP